MANLKALQFSLMACSLLLIPTGASAIPVQWTIDRLLSLSDGGVAVGSFVYDADTNEYSDVAIWTSVGREFSGSVYNYVRPEASDSSRVWLLEDPSEVDGKSAFIINLAGTMTNAGGLVATFFTNSFEGPCVALNPPFERCDGVQQSRRLISEGPLVGTAVVPISAALWLFGSALGLLGWVGRGAA